MPIGIMDTRILITYFVSAFISNLNKPRNIQPISFHNITKSTEYRSHMHCYGKSQIIFPLYAKQCRTDSQDDHYC